MQVQPGTYRLRVQRAWYDDQILEDVRVTDQDVHVTVTLERAKVIRNALDMAFVLLAEGVYEMGSRDPQAPEDEKPAHRVRINPFYMGMHEVTQGQWLRVMGANPSRFQRQPNPQCMERDPAPLEEDLSRPVECVSWTEVQDFLRALNAQEGGAVYRLPTEAEWEYAARAGTSTPYSFGEDPARVPDHAWCTGEATASTHPVGGRQPNPWGLYDMYGNVWEWVADWWSRRGYTWEGGAETPARVADNPTGPASGQNRVYRGGGVSSQADDCRSARRDSDRPDAVFRHKHLGFRIVRTLP